MGWEAAGCPQKAASRWAGLPPYGGTGGGNFALAGIQRNCENAAPSGDAQQQQPQPHSAFCAESALQPATPPFISAVGTRNDDDNQKMLIPETKMTTKKALIRKGGAAGCKRPWSLMLNGDGAAAADDAVKRHVFAFALQLRTFGAFCAACAKAKRPAVGSVRGFLRNQRKSKKTRSGVVCAVVWCRMV